MGLRFHRSIRLGKLLHLNISKTGPSLSVGEPGASINLRADKVRGTVGIPGTGISYRTSSYASAGGGVVALILALLIIFFLVLA